MAPVAPERVAVSPPGSLTSALPEGGRVVALAPGGARNVLADDALRRWPIRRYGQLAERLRGDGHTVVLTGGPGDEWVREEMPGAGACVDLIGRTSVPELIGVLSAADVVVTHDSGPLHLALMAGVPLVALFGPTNPAEKVPRGGDTTVLWGGDGLACRPCYDGRTYAVCSSRACLRQIDVVGVHRAVNERIQPA
jgi:heptosyltransferase-2